MNIKLLADLFFTFARIGAVTFGGGYAMLMILLSEIVEKKKWITEEELTDYYVIAQCTPGVIAVNVATFVGRKNAGTIGGVIATLGVVFPSLVIITLLAGVIQAYASLEWVASAFAGVRVCVCVLIFNAVSKIFGKSVVDRLTMCVYLVILAGATLTNLPPVAFVAAAGILGVTAKVITGAK